MVEILTSEHRWNEVFCEEIVNRNENEIACKIDIDTLMTDFGLEAGDAVQVRVTFKFGQGSEEEYTTEYVKDLVVFLPDSW